MATLHPVALTSPNELTKLVNILTANAPTSVVVLGHLIQEGPEASKDGDDGKPKLQAWTTFPLDGPIPSLYSVLVLPAYQPNQFRFFCSAEVRDEGASGEEEAHVLDLVQTLLREVIAPSPTLYPQHPLPNGKSAVGLMAGTMHEKWVTCLRPYTIYHSPCAKMMCPPGRVQPTPSIQVPGIEYTNLRESDIDVVQSTSEIPRTREYFISRIHASICAREVESGEPAAWILTHSDGSIGSLWVQPAYRRRGLAKVLMNKIQGAGPAGWNWVDVKEGNAEGNGFYAVLGWKKGWSCSWTQIVLEKVN